MSHLQETIYFFRSERNTEHNHGFYNPSKYYIGTVEGITSKDLSDLTINDGKVYDNAGNLLPTSEEDIERFQKGELSRLVIDWDGIYDTSYYVRESSLNDDEQSMIQNIL